MPHKHVENVFELDDVTGAALMAAAVKVARAVRDAFNPDGLSLWQSNGRGARQEVPHFHMHVMPRWVDDGLLRIYPEFVPPVEMTAREDMAAQIRSHL